MYLPGLTMLRGDDGYNPREVCVAWLGKWHVVTGIYRDDGVRSMRRPPRPFRIFLPFGFRAWHSLNTKIFYSLQSNVPGIALDLR